MGKDKQDFKYYGVQRIAKDDEEPRQRRSWLGKVIVPGVVLLCVAALIVIFLVKWSLGRVTTVRATVCAAVVSLSSDVDARLKELYVRPGQHVAKGQKLALLDDSELLAALAAAKADRHIKRNLHARAEANRRLIQAQTEARVKLAAAQVRVAEARVGQAEAAFKLRKAQLAEESRRDTARRDEARARLELLRKGPRPEEIGAAKARMQAAEALAELYALEVKQSEQLVGKGIDSEHILQIKKTRLATQQKKVRETELMLAQLQAGATSDEIEATTQVLAARDAELALGHAAGNQLEVLGAELAVRQAELHKAQAELKLAEASRLQVELVRQEVEAAAAELRKAEAEVARRQAALEGMSIVSPVTGTVVRTFDRVGEVCRKGLPTILVADDSAGRWVEAFVREDDVHLVQVGQPARIEMVVGSRCYVDGTVKAVALSTHSLDREVSDAGTARRGIELVWVKLVPVKLEGNPLPGMSARATIKVR